VLTGLLAGALPATASPADTQLASTNPQNNTPKVVGPSGSRVNAIVRIGDTVIVGGDFTQVQEDAPGSPILTRTGLFAFNATTGQVSTSFNPLLESVNGKTPEVDVLVPSADGQSVYVGGDFRTINSAGPARLQELSLADGSKVGAFNNPAFNSRVYDAKLVGNRLYVAGSFKSVGGVSRGGLATLDATTGALTDAVNLPFTGTNQGGVTTVRKIDVTPTGDRLVAIGNFTAVAGQPRVQVAMLNTSGANATVDTWSTTRFGSTSCSTSFDTYLHDVDLSPDGSFFVVVTTGGPGDTNRMCDSASRWETYAGASQSPTWVDYTGGDTFWAVEVTGPVAYVGGHFRWLNNPSGSGDTAGPGAYSREGMAAIDTRNGLPFSWNPTRPRGVGLFDWYVTQSELWAGSDTCCWAGETHNRLAAFPWQGGIPLPSDKLGTVPGDVVQLDSDSQTGVDVKSRYLVDTSSPATVSLGTAGTDWSRTRGAFMVNDTLYTGWSDGTLKQQSFDGNTFGAQSTVNLSGGSLSGDLNSTSQKLNSMFYDPRTGRMYYTKANSSNHGHGENNDGGLFYRYFTPEDSAVGSLRFSDYRAASVTAIDAAHIRGAFLSGNWLYYVTSAGQLRRITFAANGTFGATSELVNGSIDWRAQGLFLSTQPSIQAPNSPPTANFTQSCVGLSCSFDASGSTDSDGTVATYSWNFGDGSGTQTGKTVQHIFPSANSYPVTLTVTDNDGAPDDQTNQVSVAPIPSAISFRASGKYEGKQVKSHNWQLPNGIQNGDTIVMALSVHNTSDPGPILDATKAPIAGWVKAADVTDEDTRTAIYTKSATAADSGSTVDVEFPVSTRLIASMAVYDGVASVGPITTAGELSTKQQFTHTTPSVNVPANGSWVVSYWEDKTAVTTDWTVPTSQQKRVQAISWYDPAFPDTVRVTGVLTDDGAPTVAGTRPGLDATATGKSTSATMASIVLQSE